MRNSFSSSHRRSRRRRIKDIYSFLGKLICIKTWPPVEHPCTTTLLPPYGIVREDRKERNKQCFWAKRETSAYTHQTATNREQHTTWFGGKIIPPGRGSQERGGNLHALGNTARLCTSVIARSAVIMHQEGKQQANR